MTDDTAQRTSQPLTSAEVFPFPIIRTESGRFIAAEYARRPEKGRYNKAQYGQSVIDGAIERLRRLGVSQRRIDAEVASLQSMFDAMSSPHAPEKVRA